jgi:hypothetical protein
MTTHFPRQLLLAFALSLCTVLGLTGTQAQKVDAEFLRAISTIYAGGFTGQIIKEWCDERVPNLSDQNVKVLEAWRVKMDLPAIDARLIGLVGAAGKDKVTASLEDNRGAFYEQLDKGSTDPESDCSELGKALNDDFNLKVLYANEYKIVAAQPAGGNAGGNAGGSSAGSSTGTGKESAGPSGTGPGTNSPSGTGPSKTSKLPVLPPFDYATFAKLKIDPSKEPIPDEYHCYPDVTGEKYATHLLTLQILPGRKYRAGLGTDIDEGAFEMNGNYVRFTSGALRSSGQNFYLFGRTDDGARLTLRDLGSEDNNTTFECYQRGGPEQLQQLRFKRKDPQPGSYACVTTDGSNKAAGALDVLPGRRYRYQGSQGAYKANITGGLDGDSSRLVFTGGGLDDQIADYEESETGQQVYDFYRPEIECTRQVAPRPNPKFGTAKAPPPLGMGGPGSQGLEGRYFFGRPQVVDYNNNVPCQGICYEYRIFQKNGYVYNDDLEATEGLADADCTRTYPSGFPVCKTYSLKDGKLQIGLEKPEPFAKTKTGLKMDGDDWEVLEPLDGLKFNSAYSSQRVTGTVTGTGGGSSSVGLALRKDGRFSREASSNFFFGTTDTGTSTGNITASASGSSSRSTNGSYRVYGNTIEFKYDDGQIVRDFMFLPGGRKALTFLHIGGSIYLEDKPTK